MKNNDNLKPILTLSANDEIVVIDAHGNAKDAVEKLYQVLSSGELSQASLAIVYSVEMLRAINPDVYLKYMQQIQRGFEQAKAQNNNTNPNLN